MKRVKIDLLRSQYENFSMQEHETIDNMVTRFTKITNGLSSLGDGIDNDQRVRKIIRALPPSWEVKATTLNPMNPLGPNPLVHPPVMNPLGPKLRLRNVGPKAFHSSFDDDQLM